MAFVRKACTASVKTKKLVAHTAIFTVLLLFALWDVTWIIYEYIHDNRFSIVTLENVQSGNYPFLNNSYVQMCMDYSSQTIFRDVWMNKSILNETGPYDDDFFWNLTYVQGSVLDIKSLSVFAKIKLAKKFGEIQDMDDSFLYVALDISRNVSAVGNFSHLDNMLSDAFWIQKLEINLWTEVKPYSIIRQFVPPNNSDFLAMYFNHRKICADIFLRVLFNKRISVSPYFIGAVAEQKMARILEVEPKLELASTNFKSVAVPLEKSTFTTIVVNIANVGIYKKYKTTPNCIEESTIHFRNQSARSDCKSRLYLEALQRTCGCVPFSYKHYFKPYNGPFCTSRNYLECVPIVKDILRKISNCPVPCVATKNQYTVSSSISKSDIYCLYTTRGQTECPRAKLDFQCAESSYAIFDERFQLTSQQLVSQVGGDLGLYTGISILGIWQFFAWIYLLYHKKKTKPGPKEGDQKKDPNKESSLGISDALTGYLEASDTVLDAKFGHDHQNHVGGSAIYGRMEKRLQKLENGQERLQKAVDEIRDSVRTFLARVPVMEKADGSHIAKL